ELGHVDVRYRHVRAQAEHRDQADREQDLLAKVRDLERVDEGSEHGGGSSRLLPSPRVYGGNVSLQAVDHDGSTSPLDLIPGGGRDGVGVDRERPVERAAGP